MVHLRSCTCNGWQLSFSTHQLALQLPRLELQALGAPVGSKTNLVSLVSNKLQGSEPLSEREVIAVADLTTDAEQDALGLYSRPGAQCAHPLTADHPLAARFI